MNGNAFAYWKRVATDGIALVFFASPSSPPPGVCGADNGVVGACESGGDMGVADIVILETERDVSIIQRACYSYDCRTIQRR